MDKDRRVMICSDDPNSFHFEILGDGTWACSRWGCTPADLTSPPVIAWLEEQEEKIAS